VLLQASRNKRERVGSMHRLLMPTANWEPKKGKRAGSANWLCKCWLCKLGAKHAKATLQSMQVTAEDL